MQIVKPTLLALIICTAIVSAIGIDTLVGDAVNTLTPVFGKDDYHYDNDQENDDEINTSKSSNGGSSNMCVIRRFECGKEVSPSCFKRWRSKEVSCNSSECTGGSCMPYTVFISRYTFQQWDKEDLQGPFPRAETMCIMQQSDCPINDEFCISSISLSQSPCEVEFCGGTACMRKSVFVDQKDILVNNTVGTTISSSSRGNAASANNSSSENEDNNEESNTVKDGTNQEIEKVVQNQNLGCFNEEGNWTTDRTQCASNQKQYVIPDVKKVYTTQNEQSSTNFVEETKPADTAEVEEDIQKQIETVFIPDTQKSTLVQSLLATITEADGRIGTILSNPQLQQDIRSKLEEEREILGSLQRTVSAPNQSMRNLQQLGESISKHLGLIQTIVKSLQTDTKPPTTVTEKLDAIFTGLPEVFSLLLEEGIPVDNTMISGYIGAEAEYSPIRTACMENTSSCNDLVLVIDALGPVYQSLQESLEKAGRIDLQGKIDELLR